MCGAYTDNQPDFAWIMPGEEKRFTQVFMPYKQIGGAKNANREVVVNLQVHGTEAAIGVYVTRPRTVRVELLLRSEPVYTRTLDLTPESALVETVTALQSNALLRAGGQGLHNILVEQDLTLRVWGVDGDGEQRLIEYTPLPDSRPEIPPPATPARPPAEIASNEELFLNGLHLEQYRHATYAPEPYYEEALRRDPHDSRCNNALGLLLLRRGKFAAAEPYFRAAIRSLTRRNPNPYDGEPYYNLGLALKFQGQYGEAYDAFYKAVWNAAWQDAAYFELAQLAARGARWAEALELVTRSLERNWRRHQARQLKIALLRRLGRRAEAAGEIKVALDLDRMEFGALWERELLGLEGEAAALRLSGRQGRNFLAIALDYAQAGCSMRPWHCWMRRRSSPGDVLSGLGSAQSGQVQTRQQRSRRRQRCPSISASPTRSTTCWRSKRPCRPTPGRQRPTTWATSGTRTAASRRRSPAGSGRARSTQPSRPSPQPGAGLLQQAG